MWTYRPVISAAGSEEGWRDCTAVANIVEIIPVIGRHGNHILFSGRAWGVTFNEGHWNRFPFVAIFMPDMVLGSNP